MTVNLTKVVLRAGLLACVSLTASCGYLFGDKGFFRDKSEDYKSATLHSRLAVPQGMDDSALVDVYVIPAVQQELVLAGEFEVPRPAPLVAGAGVGVVRIQSLGDQSWALLNLAPGQLWPQVRSFLGVAGLSLMRQDARAGLMETDWAQLEDAEMASRFRFRIEQGVQRGSSELHVLQMNQAGDITEWPALSDDVEQEKELLKAVAQYVANAADSATVSMVAEQAISSEGRLAIAETAQGKSYIKLALPFNRAWASVGKAIESSSFEITDRDRSAGTYYVKYLGQDADQEEGGGWFGWLFGGKDENPLIGLACVVAVGEKDAGNVEITLTPEGGEALKKRDEQSLLAIIKGNIN